MSLIYVKIFYLSTIALYFFMSFWILKAFFSAIGSRSFHVSKKTGYFVIALSIFGLFPLILGAIPFMLESFNNVHFYRGLVLLGIIAGPLFLFSLFTFNIGCELIDCNFIKSAHTRKVIHVIGGLLVMSLIGFLLYLLGIRLFLVWS